MRLPALLLAASLLAGVPAARAADDAFKTLEREFPAQVALRGDPSGRVNLVSRLGTFDSADGARLLMGGLDALVTRIDADLEIYGKLRKEYEEINVPLDVRRDNFKARTELQKRLMEEEAKQRDDGTVLDAFRTALRKYQDTKALSTLSSEARRLKSWRALETAAEGIASNPGGSEAGIRLAKEKDERVAAAVLRGLKGKKEDVVFKFAVECLKSPSWPVRLGAAGVMEGVNHPRVIPPLIEALAKEEGRLRDDICDALRRLTSQNFDADPEQWRLWWVENKAEMDGAGPGSALFGAFKGKGSPPEKKSVYGIESRSRRILFIIDVSGSMKEVLQSSKGTPTGLNPEEYEDLNATKIDIAKKELKRAVRSLEPEAWFNIIAFQTHIIRWKDTMVKGDMTTKNEAYAFVRDMEAAGGTWAYGAFEEAFHLGGIGAVDKNYDPAVDTIYFISDGAPTDNNMDTPELQDPEVILAAVREWNKVGKVVIHAIAIDPRAGGATFIDFMKKLAHQNGGEYTQRE